LEEEWNNSLLDILGGELEMIALNFTEGDLLSVIECLESDVI
jgi:hypothetical protein